ncbi:MAG: c-type cytochrome [bacterium]|jgi:cytochrome c556|nr:cytochrome c [Betaproteobacteria bacterium]
MSIVSRRLLTGLVAGTGLALSVGAGIASAQTPQQAIQFRKGSMQVQSWHMRTLVQMLKGQRPFDAAVYLRAANALEAMAVTTAEGFIPGSETGETRTLPEAFKDAAGFRAAVERFQGEAKKAVAAARSGDEKAMRAQVPELIKSCDGCHERFRSK